MVYRPTKFFEVEWMDEFPPNDAFCVLQIALMGLMKFFHDSLGIFWNKTFSFAPAKISSSSVRIC